MHDKRIQELLRNTELFRNLSEDEFSEICKDINPVIRTYYPGTVLEKRNNPVDFMYVVEKGEVAMEYATFTGNIYMAAVYGEGSLIGPSAIYSSPGLWPFTIITLTKVNIISFSAEPFRLIDDEMTVKERICCSMLRERVDKENRHTIRATCRAAKGIRGRLLTFFDLMQDKHGSNNIVLDMKREELAGFLNVGRSSLYRELKKLSNEGIVKIENDYTFCIDDEKLKKLKISDNYFE